MKLLLLNNISNIIRESIDSSVIIKSVLDELAQMFAAFRSYYAQVSDNGYYVIEESKNSSDIGKNISFDRIVNLYIQESKVSCLTCMKEFREAVPSKEKFQRIVMPIYHLNKLLGIIVLLTKQKIKLDDTLEVLDGVSAQLGNAIIQAELYKKMKKWLVI